MYRLVTKSKEITRRRRRTW